MVWWDKDRFDYTGFELGDFLKTAPHKIEYWWDSKVFNKPFTSDECYTLIVNNKVRKHFKLWWNPKKWNWEWYSLHLAIHASEFIELWWDVDLYNWSENSSEEDLFTHAYEYRHIWNPKL